MKNQTLVVKGDFDGISTGINGGRRKVGAVINHEVGRDFSRPDHETYLDEVAASHGVEKPYFGFLTAVNMKNLCLVRDPYVTVFVTAGISNPTHDPGVPGTINIILVVPGRLTEGALASGIIIATEAKAKVLFEMGLDFTGTTTDAVAVLAENRETYVAETPFYEYSGTVTQLGQSIYRCVKKGVAEAIKRQHLLADGGSLKSRTFVLAEKDGGHYWIGHPTERKGPCPYYPCHFKGQECTHCFCPLYPCEDRDLGEWLKTDKGYAVWGCKDCILLHHRDAVEYLAEHPEADTREIKAALRRKHKGEE